MWLSSEQVKKDSKKLLQQKLSPGTADTDSNFSVVVVIIA